VTPDRCYVSSCNGMEVHPYGAHPSHVSGIVKSRHDGLRDLYARGIREPQRTSGVYIDVVVEPTLESYNIAKRTDAPISSSARADIGLFIPNRNWTYFLDVTVTSPSPGSADPAACLLEAEQRKYDRYLPNYHLNKPQLIPLVFAHTGGWSEQTVKFTQTIFREIANGDEARFNKLYNRFRYRVAIILAIGEGRILNWLSWKNRFPHSLGLADLTNGRSAEASQSPVHEGSAADETGIPDVDDTGSSGCVSNSLGGSSPGATTGTSQSDRQPWYDPDSESGPEGGSPPIIRPPTPIVGRSGSVVSSYSLRSRCRNGRRLPAT
jgi:hypothetical protein